MTHTSHQGVAWAGERFIYKFRCTRSAYRRPRACTVTHAQTARAHCNLWESHGTPRCVWDSHGCRKSVGVPRVPQKCGSPTAAAKVWESHGRRKSVGVPRPPQKCGSPTASWTGKHTHNCIWKWPSEYCRLHEKFNPTRKPSSRYQASVGSIIIRAGTPRQPCRHPWSLSSLVDPLT